MQRVHYIVSMSFNPNGSIDRVAVGARIAEALERAFLEGVLTPDGDDAWMTFTTVVRLSLQAESVVEAQLLSVTWPVK